MRRLSRLRWPCSIVVLLSLLWAGGPAAGQTLAREVRTPARPSYVLSLTSDTQGFVWSGNEKVSFANASVDPLSTVWLRLWDNGIDGCGPSLAIEVSNVRGGTPGPLSVDCTALPIDLPDPLPKGERASIAFDLTITVPDRNDRFGHIGSMALVGNAVPVLAIQDSKGVHLDPYVGFGEAFYSQIGNFTVTFDTPDTLSLPATGTVVQARARGGRSITTYRASSVRDFAWASGPLREIDAVNEDGVTIRVWWPHNILIEYAIDALAQGQVVLADHAARYGDYPYPELDIVMGQFTSFGGMEYPQLVMVVPSDLVLVHELGHQWWYGLVGDDQYNEPWLDEAFASYVTDIYYEYHGENCASIPFPSESARITNTMAYWSVHPEEYGVTVYTLGSCALHDLARIFGRGRMDDFMFDYAVKLALGWSTTPLFKAAAQRVADHLPVPVDLTQFWIDHRID